MASERRQKERQCHSLAIILACSISAARKEFEMSAKRLVLAVAAAILGFSLAGCVDGGPYYGSYTYSDYGPYYGPGYYGGAVYGGYYTSYRRPYRRHYDRYYRSGHYSHRSHYRRGGDRGSVVYRTPDRSWRDGRDDSSRRTITRSSRSSQVNRTSYRDGNHGSRRHVRQNDERQ